MWGRLRRRLVALLPEPTLRRLQRIRHGEHPSLHRPIGPARTGRGAPQIVTEYDAHAVRAEVVRTLAAALAAASVPYVLVPAARGAVRQVAVDGADRETALAALSAVTSGAGWSVRPRPSERVSVLRVRPVLAAPDGTRLDTLGTACEIGFWRRVTTDDVPRADGQTHARGTRLAPAENPVVGYLTESAWQRATQSPTHWPVDDPQPYAFDVREPVDIVYTWVDGNDADWQRRKAEHAPERDTHNRSATVQARFLNRDELRYSLRSVAMFASWVRRIHLVTDGQVPDWLDVDHPKIRIVDHREIFTDAGVLPVFNSHAIESQLHHIPDLAEQYLYLNDDVFFGRPVEPELFFHGNGIAKFFFGRYPIDLDPPSLRDLPALTAAKLHRELLERDFGVTVRRKFMHGVHPQLRSVVAEMEQRYPKLFATVARSRFRHPDDVAIPSALHHYYAYVRARAVPGELRYRYQEISEPNTARRLDEFLRQRPEVFCINDMDTQAHELPGQLAVLRQFFAEYFPLPSPYEKPGAGTFDP